MMKEVVNGLEIVNSLAKITSCTDRHLLETSIVNTAHDLFPEGDVHLYSLKNLRGTLKVQLLAMSQQTDESKLTEISIECLNALLQRVIKSKSVESVHNESQDVWHLAHPAFEHNNDIFAILLNSCKKPSQLMQDTLSGIFKVYSNYICLLDKSERDKLTGLYNRETLNEHIYKSLAKDTAIAEWHLASFDNDKRDSCEGTTYLGLVDIDNFKQINDTLGHLYGDEILVLISRLMMEQFIRNEDYVFRFGGEEFVILLRAGSDDQAFKAFERLRSNIQSFRFPQLKQVTVSIGFEKIAGQSSSHQVISAADKALYFAKEMGKNRTESYQNLLNQGKLVAEKEISNSDIEFF